MRFPSRLTRSRAGSNSGRRAFPVPSHPAAASSPSWCARVTSARLIPNASATSLLVTSPSLRMDSQRLIRCGASQYRASSHAAARAWLRPGSPAVLAAVFAPVITVRGSARMRSRNMLTIASPRMSPSSSAVHPRGGVPGSFAAAAGTSSA